MSLRSIIAVLLLSVAAVGQTRAEQLIAAARTQISVTTGYDGRYVRISYPDGDVDSRSGVCTDVVIRAFRKLHVDLQKEVHEDMLHGFSAYPRRWGMRAPDSNIDHRRVPNLMTYFSHKGKALPVSTISNDYAPGDIVAWDLGHGVTHIGIVSNEKALLQRHYKIIHNIGGGAKEEDMLFQFKIIGHYRYF